ncbi:MAG: hypothetical protein ISR76_05835 [Planctomycetes bacterium]|nr:hypothetical protein [Planctomycetota bacterium]
MVAISGKKAFEKRAGRKLLRATGLLREYRLLAFEQPDLLACHNGAVVGIEVSRLFRDEGETGRPQHRAYSQRRQVLRAAQVRHRLETESTLDLMVEFCNGSVVEEGRVPELVDALLEAAQEAPEEVGEQRTLPEDPVRRAGLAGVVQAVRATRLEGREGPLWGMVSEPWTDERVRALVQLRLDKKEELLDRYRTDGVLAQWLLLMCDGLPGRRPEPPHPCAAPGSYRSSFSRVFVMDFTGRHWCELALERDGRTG